MKKTIISVSGFDAAALTRELKASDRLQCRVYDGDERIYITNGFFAVALLPFEYDELARPAFQTDAGNLIMDRAHGCKAEAAENVMDIRKVFELTLKDRNEPLRRAPIAVPGAAFVGGKPKTEMAFAYSDKTGVCCYNKRYFDVFAAHELKAAGATSPAACSYCDTVVGLLLPVRPAEGGKTAAVYRAVKSYFTDEAGTKQAAAPASDKTTAELQQALEAKSHANRALNNELNAERDKFHELEQHNAANVKALEEAQNEIARLRAELEAAKAAAQKPAAPAETKPEPKTAAELIAARWTKDGITATIKGAATAAPVVWLDGVNKKQAEAVKAAGGAFSKKRNAYYFRVA